MASRLFATTLVFAVRPRVVVAYLGLLLAAAAALASVPTAVAFAHGQTAVGLRYLLAIALLGCGGGLGARFGQRATLQVNEALVVSAASFLIPSLAFAIPLAGYGHAPVDAFFEAVSGVTTTGLSVLPPDPQAPASFLFGRAWMQWIGGLGVVTLALALLLDPGASASRLGFDDREATDLAGGTLGHARRVLAIYLALSLAGFALLWLLSGDLLEASVHALAGVSTGGFSTGSASLAAHGPWFRGATMALCLAGSISMSWYYLGHYRSRPTLAAHGQLVGLLVCCAVGSGAVLLFQWLGGAVDGARDLGDAFLMAVSAQSTAGFSSVDTASLEPATKLVLAGSMFTGGGLGSTAGGIKVLRLLVLGALLLRLIKRSAMPASAVLPDRLFGSPLRRRETEAAAAVVLAYLGLAFASWLPFVAAGHDPLDSLFDVVSALGTVGLSSGVVGPDLETGLKLILCLDMLLGRVEIIAFFVLFWPGTWLGRRRTLRASRAGRFA